MIHKTQSRLQHQRLLITHRSRWVICVCLEYSLVGLTFGRWQTGINHCKIRKFHWKDLLYCLAWDDSNLTFVFGPKIVAVDFSHTAEQFKAILFVIYNILIFLAQPYHIIYIYI